MFSKEEYMNYLKREFTKSGLAEDLKVSIHDEFYYQNDADLDVTVKMLPGQVQCGVVQFPVELLIEVKEKFTKEVIDVLTDFSIEHNEVVHTFDCGTFKQYYSTPNVIGTFQSTGLSKRTAISISVSIISFNNVMRLKTFQITSCNTGKTIVVNPVNFVMSYMIDANASGSVNDARTRSVGEVVATTWTISVVPTTDEIFTEIIKVMVCDATPNAKFIIVLQFNDEENKILCSGEDTVIIQSGSFSQQSNGLPIMELTFIRGVK